MDAKPSHSRGRNALAWNEFVAQPGVPGALGGCGLKTLLFPESLSAKIVFSIARQAKQW
jgi:hypothetical protein